MVASDFMQANLALWQAKGKSFLHRPCKEPLAEMAMSKALGNVLREARKAAGLTQGDVANAIGVSRAAVGQWENGDDPATDNLIAACKHLKIDLQSAINGELRQYPIAGYPATYDQKQIFATGSESLYAVDKIIDFENKEETGKIANVVSMAHAQDSEMVLIGVRPLFYTPFQWLNDNGSRFYALGLETNHAEPVVQRGDFALVDSVMAPSIGDHVVVMLKSSEPIRDPEHIIDGVPTKAIPMLPGYVGKFIDHTAQTIVLSQPYPETRISIKLSHISWMHKIVPTTPGKLAELLRSK